MTNLIDELKRRKVFRTGASYLVVAWLLLQLTDLVLENMNAPDWVMQAIMLVLAIGLPVVLILSWAFDLSPEGINTESATSTGTVRRFYALVGLVAVTAVGLTLWYAWVDPVIQEGPPGAGVASEHKPADESLLSIAVLPFETLSRESEDQYFADGLADTLLHKLAQLQTLTVIARNSSFQFKGKNVDVREVGRILGVPTVLEGTVQRQGDAIRVIAQLVSTRDGAHWWSGTFDGTFDNIFDLQDRIAAAIATQLQIALSDQELQRLYKRGTEVPEAYDAVARARAIELDFDGSGFDPDSNQRVTLLKKAVALDPNYALGWAALSIYYNSLAFYDRGSSRFDEFVAESFATARRAVQVDPDEAEGYVALGFSHWRLQQRAQAEEAYRAALARNPNNDGALAGLGLVLLEDSPQEAYRLFKRSQEIAPGGSIVYRQLFFALSAMGRTGEAIAQLEQGILEDPDYFLLYSDLADAHAGGSGRFDKAAKVASELLLRDSGSSAAKLLLARGWLDVADVERARAWLGELPDHDKAGADVKLLHIRLYQMQGDGAAAMEIANSLPARGTGILARANTLIKLCMAAGRRECALPALRDMESFSSRFEASGGSLPRGVEALLELYRGWLGHPDADAASASLENAAALYARLPLSSAVGIDGGMRRYALAETLTLQGRYPEAVAELKRTLDLADGGIIPDGLDGLPADRSVVLGQLSRQPGYADWLQAYTSRRQAMHDRMVAMEERGEITAAPGSATASSR